MQNDSMECIAAVRISAKDYDLLSAKLAQLRALLLTISGSGFSNFLELAELEQERVIWLAADLAGAANELVGRQE